MSRDLVQCGCGGGGEGGRTRTGLCECVCARDGLDIVGGDEEAGRVFSVVGGKEEAVYIPSLCRGDDNEEGVRGEVFSAAW